MEGKSCHSVCHLTNSQSCELEVEDRAVDNLQDWPKHCQQTSLELDDVGTWRQSGLSVLSQNLQRDL